MDKEKCPTIFFAPFFPSFFFHFFFPEEHVHTPPHTDGMDTFVSDSRLLSEAAGGENDEDLRGIPAVNLIAVAPDCSKFVSVVTSDVDVAVDITRIQLLQLQSASTEICAWDTTTGRPLATANIEQPAHALAFSQDSSLIAVVSHSKFFVWRLSADCFNLLSVVSLHKVCILSHSYVPPYRWGAPHVLAISGAASNNMVVSSHGAEDEKGLLIVDWIKRIRVDSPEASGPRGKSDGKNHHHHHHHAHDYERRRQQQQHQQQLHTTCINSAIFSPDGSKLVTGAGSIRIWDTRRAPLKLIARMASHSTTYALAFSTDGLLLASCDYNERVFVWNLSAVAHDSPSDLASSTSDGATLCPEALFITSGYPPQTERDFDASVGTAVVFSRDGNRIFMANSNSKVWEWDMQQQNAVALLEANGSMKFNKDELEDKDCVDKTIKPFLGRGFSTVHRLPAKRYGKRVAVAFGALASGDMLVVSVHNKGRVFMMNIAASAAGDEAENDKSTGIDLAAIREALPVDDSGNCAAMYGGGCEGEEEE